MSTPHVVDARGMLCPWPVLRLTRAVREQGAGRFRLLADDPSARKEVEQLCEQRGWRIDPDPDHDHAYNVVIP